MLKLEKRISHELRMSEDGKKITGYAAVFNSDSEDLGGFTERILPGAFDGSLAAGADVRALIDHDSSRILGRTISGTLRMRTDERGLAVEIDPPSTQYAVDLMTVMQRGDVTQMSFAFHSAADKWSVRGDGTRLREISNLSLVDVSVVTYPAYPETTVAVRSLSRWQVEREIRARLLRLYGRD